MTTETTIFQVGDHVTLDPAVASAPTRGVVYRVDKVPSGVRGVYYQVSPVSGSARGWRVRGEHLVRATDGAVKAAEVAPEVPRLGAVVRSKMPRHEGIFVVLAEARKPGHSRIARLGGDPDGRYYASFPNAMLTVIDPEKVAISD